MYLKHSFSQLEHQDFFFLCYFTLYFAHVGTEALGT